MPYSLFTCPRQHVDHWQLNHGVASWLLTDRGACHVHENLTGEGGVVDAHGELHALVLRRSANALTCEVNSVSHVLNVIN